MNSHDIESAVSVSENLDQELVNLPGLLWHYGDLEAAAYQKALEAKADLEQAHAAAYKVRKEHARKDRVTEAHIEAEIELDPTYRRYVAAHAVAEGNARRMKALVESLRAKRDALVQLGANHRMQVNAGLDHVRR